MSSRKNHSNNAINHLDTSINNLLKVNLEDLVRLEELGTELSFKEIETDLTNLFEILKKVKEVDYNYIPLVYFNKLQTSIDSLSQLVEKIINFDPKKIPNTASARNRLITDFDSVYNGVYNNSIPILNISLLFNNDLSIEKSKVN